MSGSYSLNVDVIVAGGGTIGCDIAGRLAAADPSLKILILEAGPPTFEDLAHVQPARYLTHLLPGSKTIKTYIGKESAALGGRSPAVPCGQCLGGGSSVNCASNVFFQSVSMIWKMRVGRYVRAGVCLGLRRLGDSVRESRLGIARPHTAAEEV